LLLAEARLNGAFGHIVCGFIDDDPNKRNKRIHGLPVLGYHAELENILSRSGCTELVVAITDPPAELMRELVILGR
jgi:dTDP-glucose 4,6-dehydratase